MKYLVLGFLIFSVLFFEDCGSVPRAECTESAEDSVENGSLGIIRLEQFE